MEGRLAGSWVSYTRDEYEKNLREGIKQDIISYVSKMAFGLFVFLGGAGTVYVGYVTKASFREANLNVVQDLHAQYDLLVGENQLRVARESRRVSWQRYHQFGVEYRYIARLYSLSALQPGSKKQDQLDDLFAHAKTYYDLALGADPSQSSTHFEIAQLYYTYANDFDVPKWKKSEAAFEEYQRAVDLATPEEIANAWRAQSLTMMGAIELDGYRSVSQSFREERAFLRKLRRISRKPNWSMKTPIRMCMTI